MRFCICRLVRDPCDVSEWVETIPGIQDTRPEHAMGSSVIIKETCLGIEACVVDTPSAPRSRHLVRLVDVGPKKTGVQEGLGAYW